MRRGYFTPPVLIILAIIIFAVAILIAINTDLVKRLKKAPPPTSSPSPITQQSSPTPDETANWKTFINTEYGFSFRYKETEIIKETGNTYAGELLYVYIPTPPKGDDGTFRVSIYGVEKLAALRSMWKSWRCELGGYYEVISEIETTFQGRKAYETRTKDCSTGETTLSITVETYDHVFVVSGDNRILSTFRFLE